MITVGARAEGKGDGNNSELDSVCVCVCHEGGVEIISLKLYLLRIQ